MLKHKSLPVIRPGPDGGGTRNRPPPPDPLPLLYKIIHFSAVNIFLFIKERGGVWGGGRLDIGRWSGPWRMTGSAASTPCGSAAAGSFDREALVA